MIKDVLAFAVFNNRTGYGIHAANFFGELNKIIPVRQNQAGGDIAISLMDSVSAQNIPGRVADLSILYNVWESTRQPDKFIENLKYFDQLWVPSEWQRQCTIEQGVDPDFIKVVPEGIDPRIFKPGKLVAPKDTFDFLIVGKWETRKCTTEMIASWMDVFPLSDYGSLRLYVCADNPFNQQGLQTTEELLKYHHFIDDPRIIPISFESEEAHIRRLQFSDVYLSCSRAEGWNLPLIEAMACGIPSIALNHSGSTEFAKDAMLVKIEKMMQPFGVIGFDDCPGEWAVPDFNDLKRVIKESYRNYSKHVFNAQATSKYIRKHFSWQKAAQKAYGLLCDLAQKKSAPTKSIVGSEIVDDPEKAIHELCSKFFAETSKIGYKIDKLEVSKKNDIFAVGCWPSTQERLETLIETINQIRAAGYPVLISSHYPLPEQVTKLADYYIFEKDNILSDEDFHPVYTRTNQAGEIEKKKSDVRRHDVACLSAIRNALDFCRGKFDYFHFMEFDVEVDLPGWLQQVQSSGRPLNFIEYEGKGVRTDFFSGKTADLDVAIPRVKSWKQYLEYGGGKYVLEVWLRHHLNDLGYFSEDQIALLKHEVVNRFDQVDRTIWPNDVFNYHFVEGPYLQVNGISNRVYDVCFRNPYDGDSYRAKLKCGHYARPSVKYFRDWEILASENGVEKFHAKLNLAGQRVLISLGSKALGDTLAWMPIIEEFRKKHGCRVIASTWWNDLFDYPEIEFVKVGQRVDNLHASYEIGCFDGDRMKNPRDWRTVTMQEIATDILGLEYTGEIRPRMKSYPPCPIPDKLIAEKYMCFSEHSTMHAKLWNRSGAWQEIIDYVKSAGFKPVSISREPCSLRDPDIIRFNGKTIEEVISVLSGAKYYVGLGHGPSWLAWALNIPVVMISGFSEPWAEFPTPYRVINQNVCHGCFNDPSVKFDRGWEWCPQNKDYECTREITPEMVIDQINNFL